MELYKILGATPSQGIQSDTQEMARNPDSTTASMAHSTNLTPSRTPEISVIPKATLERGPPLPAFSSFSRLPSEIRLKIWTCALGALAPRILELEYREREKKRKFRCPTPSRSAPFAFLHACRESRQEAMKIYEVTHSGAEINWAVDTFYLRYLSDPSTFIETYAESVPDEKFLALLSSGSELKKLRRLALWHRTWDAYMRSYQEDNGNWSGWTNQKAVLLLEKLPALEELIIVCEDDGCAWEMYHGWTHGSEIIPQKFEVLRAARNAGWLAEIAQWQWPILGTMVDDVLVDQKLLHRSVELKFQAFRRNKPPRLGAVIYR